MMLEVNAKNQKLAATYDEATRVISGLRESVDRCATLQQENDTLAEELNELRDTNIKCTQQIEELKSMLSGIMDRIKKTSFERCLQSNRERENCNKK